jgi:hypothetical protein
MDRVPEQSCRHHSGPGFSPPDPYAGTIHENTFNSSASIKIKGVPIEKCD